ncbi:HugZ family protein [Nitratireductor sp. L1-7-SE]|uniref:HugZ family protein n=1 Tax=Nitratireductor rhodophyticola TaxID=2854036 RepID=A0ABS7R9F0_9HYPH|nr:HugZ family protein [Nitratireductor rhodophyticola]MBY8917554.1 HugZ family protein [Nitratireductor rhodophyticola]MBY8922265.1 HugZ family protein [Nitratireductor rhodophyticola]
MSAEKQKDVILETDADAIRLAKTLLRTARFGALATIDPEDGAPFATRVATATDLDGTPLILVSGLSAHTKGLDTDPRCSLMIGEPGKGDPLAHPRLSIKAVASRLERGSEVHERVRRRYLARHPKAKLYVDFPDFIILRLELQGALLNGGFARAYRLTGNDLLTGSAAVEGLAEAEAGAIAHMNSDHADAVENYARHFARAPAGKWRLTGIDPEGLDLALGDEMLRIFFAAPLSDATQMRPTLVAMAKEARAGLAA